MMQARKQIGLVAHDGRKPALVAWCSEHRETLARHALYATGTSGQRVAEATGLEIHRMKSGPLGGDAQLGAMIAEEKLDLLIFFIDPLTALPHDVDVKALLRLATLHGTVVAMNRASADFVVSSPRMDTACERVSMVAPA